MLLSQPPSGTGTVHPISQKKLWPRKLKSQNKGLSVLKFSAEGNGGLTGTKGDTVPGRQVFVSSLPSNGSLSVAPFSPCS